jgi:2-oxoglutarate/2-oxoacid ferredoxin oxidoreductase subunit alpha
MLSGQANYRNLIWRKCRMSETKILMNGCDAVVLAALDSECNFFAGYPITPATPILLQMIQELPKKGGIAVQAEDEIASIGFCLGAVMTGARALTATSGPGMSLYSENIGLAIMAEIPLVIVDVQRMGPATGAATTTAQGDVQFLRWGTSGGYPLIVLCPTNVEDCYNLTCSAFQLSERFRVPVILATDKETAATLQTVETSALSPCRPPERITADPELPYKPYAVSEPSGVPALAHYGGPHLVRVNTSTHDPEGYLTKDPSQIEALNRHLHEKINAHRDALEFVEVDLEAGADTLIISYGVTARSAAAAVSKARSKGCRVSLLTIRSLWPVPEKSILSALNGANKIIVAELNQGQYLREIERIVCDRRIIGIHREDGELITPEQILEEGGLL